MVKISCLILFSPLYQKIKSTGSPVFIRNHPERNTIVTEGKSDESPKINIQNSSKKSGKTVYNLFFHFFNME